MRILVLAAVALAGCATMADGEEPAAPPVAGEGACDAAPVQNLVDRPATAELGADALARSGARTLRWVPEGSAVTMDYRTDRLNIGLDRANAVAGINCG